MSQTLTSRSLRIPEKICLARPALDQADIDAAAAILSSGWLKQGQCVRDVEARLATEAGTQRALLVSSCTSALYMALSRVGVNGGEVVLPTLGFGAPVNAAIVAGARPVFADCAPETPLLTANEVAKVVSKRTKAILPIHLFGLPCNVPTILQTVDGIPVVEDVAYGIGSYVGDLQAGSIGQFGCLSFSALKTITSGEGGAILCRDADYEELSPCRDYGMSRVGSVKQFTHVGLNFKITEFQAAILLSQLRRYKEIRQHRQALRSMYEDELKHIGLDGAWAFRFGTPNDCFMPIILPENGPSAQDVHRKLLDRNVETETAFLMHRMPAFKQYLSPHLAFPWAEHWARRIICIPMHSGLTEADVSNVVHALDEVLDQ